MVRYICSGCGVDVTEVQRAYSGAPCPYCGEEISRIGVDR